LKGREETNPKEKNALKNGEGETSIARQRPEVAITPRGGKGFQDKDMRIREKRGGRE